MEQDTPTRIPETRPANQANQKHLLHRYPNEVARTFGVGVHRFIHERQIGHIRQMMALAQAESEIVDVLDCPCGSGRISADLPGFRMTCADSSSGRVQRAREHVPGAVRFDQADIFDLPYADDSFDMVLSILLLQHIDESDLPRLFSQVARVTRQWAIVTYSNRYQVAAMLRSMQPSPRHTLTQAAFDGYAAGAGFRRRARRFSLPSLAASVTVLLEKKPRASMTLGDGTSLMRPAAGG